MQRHLGGLVKAAVEGAKAKPGSPVFLFLDEITYAEDWDHWLKTFYDDNWPVRILGSSSSSAALKKRRHESGVGRWDEQYLAPYLFSEFLALVNQAVKIPVKTTLAATLAACLQQQTNLPDLDQLRRKYLLTGGFPELLIPIKDSSLDDASLLLQSQQVLRSDAVERSIYKDIPQVFGVDNPRMLERVLSTLAGQIGGVLSPSNICQTLGGLSQPTFDRYLDYLSQAFLVFTLENYAGSELARQKRGRKLYFVDGAIRNAALQRGTRPLHDPGEMGLLLENATASHLHALSQQSQVRLYYWRDKTAEVDLIYDHPSEPLAFEIGSAATHHRKGLFEFVRRFPRFKSRSYYVAPAIAATQAKDNADGVGTLPLDLLLAVTGAQAEHEMRQRLVVGS
jgi:predicted AAA+ superfamily ATPase